MTRPDIADAVADVRAEHAPNEWDVCVLCRKPWPCAAELLAELATTRLALLADTPSVEPAGLDVERLSIAMNRAYTYGTGTAEQVAAEYALLPTQASDSPEKP